MTGVRERVFSGCSLHCSMVGVGALLAAALGLGLASAPGHGQLPGSNWRVSPEPVFAVGRVDGPAEEMFSRIGGAVRLSDGRFVVADERELRIRVYSASGRRLSAFGSEGEGPGEFRTIRGIWNVPGDTLGVWDSSIQRITRFLPDGKVIGTASLRFDAAGSSVPRSPLDAFLGAFSDGRIALTWITARRVPPGRLEPDRMVFGLFDANGQFQRVIGQHTGMLRLYVPERRTAGPFAFSPFPWAAVARDTLVYTNGLAGEVLFFNPAIADETAVRTLRVPGRQPSLRSAWATLDGALEGTNALPIMVTLANSTDRSLGEIPHHARMFADDQGLIWLKEYDPARDALAVRTTTYVAGGQWRIIATDGTPIAHITFPEHVSPIAVYGDLLLAIARDTLDVEQFAVYRIIR